MVVESPKDWNHFKLNDIIVDIIDYRGKTPKKLGGDWSESGIIALSAMNVKQGQLVNLEKAKFVSEELYRKWMKSEVRQCDILMTSEAPLGETYFVARKRKICLSQRLYCIRANPDVVQPRWLFYALSSQSTKNQLHLRATGTTVLGIRQPDLREIPITVPPLPTQCKIAAILGTYDDLIENNTRRIKILEEMAGTIYREWFVEFRFPGHENVKMVESELGLIPQGWEVKKVKQLVKRLKTGQIYTQTDVEDTGKVIVADQSRADILGFHDKEPDHHATPKNPIVTFGDHTCKMQLMITPFSLGPNVVPFIARDEMPIIYLFLQVSNLVETREYKRHWTDLNNKEVVVADSQTRKQFSDVLIPTFQLIEVLNQENRNLRNTRDMLLPKLISGELDVSDLEIGTDLYRSQEGEKSYAALTYSKLDRPNRH